MNIEHVLDRYFSDARSRQLADWQLAGQGRRLHIQGLCGSQLAFVVQAVYRRKRHTQLIIAQDKEEAAYLQNTLQSLTSAQTALFFPDSYRRPLGFDKLHRPSVLQRTETVSFLLSRELEGPILITYPEALFEQVVAPQDLKRSAIEIKTGHELDLAFMTEFLQDYGFDLVDFVYEPGQFAIRGGIVDVYSYSNEYPYRVELFDTQVDSIRTFDPETQLSVQKIAYVNIVPNVNTRFKAEHKRSLLEILPEHTCVWLEDLSNLIERLQLAFEKSQAYQERLQSLLDEMREEEVSLLKEQAYLLPRQVHEQLARYNCIEYGRAPQLADKTSIEYHSAPQPSFNKNFEMLIQDLRYHQEAGMEIYLFAENSKQIERFYSIFEDLKAKINWVPIPAAMHQGFIDKTLKIVCYTDHQILERHHAYKTRKGFDKNVALRLKTLSELQPGDFVTHIDHGIGRYAGLERIEIGGRIQEAVRLVYKDNDILYVGIQSLHKISKYTGSGEMPTIHKLGSNAWANTKQKTKKKIKELAFDLIKLYAKRKASESFAFPPDNYLQIELEASFLYDDTPDQAKATEDVKADMSKPYPMDRLICGDVGFGKTEVAVRAAFKAVVNGKQVGVLVPTTILALQHARTFAERLKEFGVRVDYVNRFRTTKEKTEVYKKLAAGEIDILIGTHALLNQKVKFKDLGLLIVDEEQKFGVGDKEKLRNLRVNVHTLTLTATPIPRTLQFSMLGARDLSVIGTPPPNRQPIHTEVRGFDPDFIREAILHEVGRNGQVFFIHNRVNSLNDLASMLRELCPGVDMAVAHGQMNSDELEKTLLDFIRGYYEVLVCTNIIETGLDIPNANTIIISDAQNFGLSDLHQLRGRVGRSNRKAYCYLLAPPASVLSSDSRKRLQTIEQFSELGSGINIAMRDLDIRGAGNLLGAEQSGFIVNMGYETYQKILIEAMQELKREDFKDLYADEQPQPEDFVPELIIEADVEMLIPDTYIESIQERLLTYQKLDKLETEEELQALATKLHDRFGNLPQALLNLFDMLRLRWLAKPLGFERLQLSKRQLKCYFVGDQQSPFFETLTFQNILAYIQKHSSHRFYLKQSHKHLILTCENVKDMKDAQAIFQTMIKELVLRA